jgi:hypothetical protein
MRFAGYFIALLLLPSAAGAHPLTGADLPKVDVRGVCAAEWPGVSLDADMLSGCDQTETVYKNSLTGEDVSDDLLAYCTAEMKFRRTGYAGLAHCIWDEKGRPNFEAAKKAFGVPNWGGDKMCAARADDVAATMAAVGRPQKPGDMTTVFECARGEMAAYVEVTEHLAELRSPAFGPCIHGLLEKGDLGKSWADLQTCVLQQDNGRTADPLHY